MKGSETINRAAHGICSVRFLKNVFLAVIVLCFASILFLRVAGWDSITVNVKKVKDEIMAMNDTERLQLVRSALLSMENGGQESNSESADHNITVDSHNTTPSIMNTVQQINSELQSQFDYLYEGSIKQAPVKDKAACSSIPQKLVGNIRVFEEPHPFAQLNSLDFRLFAGGSYSPPTCNPSQKLAVVIPFRKREIHLSILLLNLHPYLQKQQRDYTIFVVNQIEGSKFNRAMLMNIGFMEAMKREKYQCIIFHDVDLLPENDQNIYSCPEDSVRHMSAYINKFNYKLPYNNILGGIVAINSHLFIQVNGYSNQFFGWGGEDDDFSARCRHKSLSIVRYPKSIARYKMIQHQKDSGNEINPKRFEMLEHTADRQSRDGLNSLTYVLKSVQLAPLYTRLNVEIDQPAVMNANPRALPDYLQSV